MTADSEKWFHSGPIDPINKSDYRKMESAHRHLYNLHKQIESKKTELNELEKKWAKESARLIKQLKNDPEHPAHDWAWIEKMKRSWPKWKQEFVRECGEPRAKEVAAKYASKKISYLRLKFIHSRPPES